MATTIQVSDRTHGELEELGKKGDTFDDIIRRLLEGNDGTPQDAESRPSRGVEELDLPGRGQTLERRREAVRALIAHIEEHGRTRKPELLELIDAEAVGYGSADSAWKNLFQPALQAVDAVEADGSGGSWVPT